MKIKSIRFKKLTFFFKQFESNKDNFFKKNLEQDNEQIIDIVASNFYLLDENIFNEINDIIVDSILSSPKLQIKSEDSLFTC